MKWLKIKDKSVGFYLELAAAVLLVVALIMGSSGGPLLNNTNFGADMIVVVVLAAVLAVAPFFHKFRFWALLPAACSFVALGILFNGGAAVIMDRINNVVYSGGNFDSVVTLFILTAAACLLCIVACFMGTERRSA